MHAEALIVSGSPAERARFPIPQNSCPLKKMMCLNLHSFEETEKWEFPTCHLMWECRETSHKHMTLVKTKWSEEEDFTFIFVRKMFTLFSELCLLHSVIQRGSFTRRSSVIGIYLFCP